MAATLPAARAAALAVCLLAASLCVALLVGALPARAAAVPRPSNNVVAVGPNGRRLPPDPMLRPHERITVTVSGFAARASVRVLIQGGISIGTFQAGRNGVATVPVTIPPATPAGQNVLIFVGNPSPDRASPARGQGPGDHQPIEVLAPRLGLLPFRNGPTSGVAGVSTGRPSGHGTGGLSATGVDVLGILAAGLLAVAAGGAVIGLARRRRGRHA